MPAGARKIARRILPDRIYHFLRVTAQRYRYSRSAVTSHNYLSRNDVEVLSVQPGVELMLYWKALPIGTGPALALFVHGSEFAKFDFFGAGRGHYHIEQSTPVSTTEDRLYFFEKTIPQQMERAVFELENNVQYHLQRHFRKKVRNTVIDQEQMHSALKKAVATLQGYLHSGTELAQAIQRSASATLEEC